MRGILSTQALAITMLSALFSSAAFAQAGPSAPIGSAVRIVNKVTAADVGMPRPLVAGDNVNQEETIEVEQSSIGELRLNDDTKLALGPGSKLKLDKFIYDPSKTTGTIAVDLTKGAFRFITGNARKPSYLIRSPNASISVRGTIFDVYVDATGNMWILLHEGSIEVCNSRGQCSELDQTCGLVRVASNGDLSGAAIWPRQPAVQEINFETAFPFVISPPQIDPSPRFTRAAIEAGTCPSDEIKLPKTRRADLEPPAEPTKPAVPNLAAPVPARTSETGKQAETMPHRPVPERASPPAETVASDEPAPARSEPADAYDVPPTGEEGPADNYYPAPPVASEDSPVRGPNWSGFYIGLTGGGASMTHGVPSGCTNTANNFASNDPRNCDYAESRRFITERFDPEPTGFAGGGVAGFNAATGSLVFGIEGDMSYSSVSGKARTRSDVKQYTYEEAEVSQAMTWFGSVRGRAGVATGNLLLFATGGLAFGEVEMKFGMTAPRNGDYASAEMTKTMAGWIAGVGAEYSLGMVSIKGEVLHYDLGTESLEAPAHFSAGARTSAVFEPEFDSRGHMARIGLNFHLN